MSEKGKKPYGFCQKCGHPFVEEDVFCEGCGTDLSKLKEAIERRKHPEEEKVSSVNESSLKKKTQGNPREIVIGILVLVLLVGVIFGGKYVIDFFGKTKPISDTWGQTYYVYLNEMQEEEKEKDAGIPEDLDTALIHFYEITELDDPIMVLSYVVDQQVYSNIYYIYQDKVNVLTYQEPMEVELLFHREKKDFSYYTHIVKDDTDYYRSISQLILSQIAKGSDDKDLNVVEENPEYAFKKDDIETITDEDGTKVEISKFDTVFVKVDDVEDQAIEYTLDLDSKELKELIEKGTTSYLDLDQVVTKDVQKEIEEKSNDITKKQENMEQIQEKIAAKGLKVGDHYLKYGKYQSNLEDGTISGGFYTLNADGTFIYENTWENMLGERTTTRRTGTYEAKFSTGDMYDPKQCWIIIFRTQESNETYPQETDVYDVLEDNTFTARQYPNTWTLVESN